MNIFLKTGDKVKFTMKSDFPLEKSIFYVGSVIICRPSNAIVYLDDNKCIATINIDKVNIIACVKSGTNDLS